jgi:microcin C transport system substrate-binding protein
MRQPSRRQVIALGIGAASAAWLPPAAANDAKTESHGISAFGDLKYPADFHHFDYVNPDAPKGGLFSTIPSVKLYNQSYLTFNSLNAFILKGEGAVGMDLTFTALMSRAGDEPDALYGLLAKSVQISDDKLIYRFTLRPEARFHDGSGITARDVAFSLTTLKAKGHPLIVQQMRDFVAAEAIDDATVVVTFAKDCARDVPLYVASLPVFSKASGQRSLQGRKIRGEPLHRIRAGQGLVGARLAGVPRRLQLRYGALRILSRSRCGLRGLHRAKLSFS